jgi:hypothetical protein
MKSLGKPGLTNSYQDRTEGESRGQSILRWWELRQYVGDAAAERIINRLSGWPKARAIASAVAAFYGDCLLYNESPALSSSLYEIRPQHDPILLEYARIQLQLGTDRIAEALSHELLHLRLGTLGYPMGDEVWMPADLVPYAHDLMGMHAIVGNLLGHELIFDTFLDLGFRKNRFLAIPTWSPDYGTIALDLSRSPDYPEELGFPWWCLEYFRHWLSRRHGAGEQSGGWADMALYWGSKVYLGMAEATDNMCRIVESGVLRDSGQYPHWANKILELMRLPNYIRWVNIRHGNASSGDKPVVMLWADKRETRCEGLG